MVTEGEGSVAATKLRILALLIGMVFLLLGYALKSQCAAPDRGPNWENTRYCFTDILHTYATRDAPFRSVPDYKSFSEGGLPYVDNNFEYPALTGLFVSAATSLTRPSTPGEYLRSNAIGLGLFGLIAIASLAALARPPSRVFFFVLAPGLILYAFHNWDLIPVAATGVGLWAFSKRRDTLAGFTLGLGAAAKFYPALFVPILMIGRMTQTGCPPRSLWNLLRDRPSVQTARGVFFGAAIGFAIPNLIVAAYARISRVWFAWDFHRHRVPNLETFWAWGYRLVRDTFQYPGPRLIGIIQIVSTLILVAAIAHLLAKETKRERFRTATLCMCALLVFLATSKFLNPAYLLWVAPFFVLVRLPLWSFGFFVLVDIAGLAAVSFYNAHGGQPEGLPYALFGLAVGLRYVMIGSLLWLAWIRGEDVPVFLQEERSGPTRAPATSGII